MLRIPFALVASAGALPLLLAGTPAAAQQAAQQPAQQAARQALVTATISGTQVQYFCLGSGGSLARCTPESSRYTLTYEERNAYVISTAADSCLDGTRGQGQRVALARCNGSPAQDWFIVGNRIQNKANDLCLDVSESRYTLGTPVILWGCSSSAANQYFAFGTVKKEAEARGEIADLQVLTISARDVRSYLQGGRFVLQPHQVIAMRGGNVIAAGGGNLIGNATGSLIGQAGSNIRPQPLPAVPGTGTAGVIGNATANVIGNASGNLIGNATGNYRVLPEDAESAVLLHDDFNAENGGNPGLNYNAFAKWEITRGTVDLLGHGFFDVYPGNGLYVDLDGSVIGAGRMESKVAVALEPGSYELAFTMGGSRRGDTNTVTVSLGSVFSQVYTLASESPLTLYTHTIHVPTATSGKVVFDHEGADYLGIILTEVRLSRVSSAPGAPAGGGAGAAPASPAFAQAGDCRDPWASQAVREVGR